MITNDYLQRLRVDLLKQLREHENNVASALGALQVVDHLMQKLGNGAADEPAPTPEVKAGKET